MNFIDTEHVVLDLPASCLNKENEYDELLLSYIFLTFNISTLGQ